MYEKKKEEKKSCRSHLERYVAVNTAIQRRDVKGSMENAP